MILPGTGRGTAAEGGGEGGSQRTLRRPEVYAARRARRKMSLPEVLLWQRLRGSPQGIAFRRQHPIGRDRVDFFCAAAKLVIEVDGIVHDMADHPVRDLTRSARLTAQGLEVLRIPAADVLMDPDGAAQSIVAYASRTLHHASGMVPLPASGEDPDA